MNTKFHFSLDNIRKVLSWTFQNQDNQLKLRQGRGELSTINPNTKNGKNGSFKMEVSVIPRVRRSMYFVPDMSLSYIRVSDHLSLTCCGMWYCGKTFKLRSCQLYLLLELFCNGAEDLCLWTMIKTVSEDMQKRIRIQEIPAIIYK